MDGASVQYVVTFFAGAIVLDAAATMTATVAMVPPVHGAHWVTECLWSCSILMFVGL